MQAHPRFIHFLHSEAICIINFLKADASCSSCIEILVLDVRLTGVMNISALSTMNVELNSTLPITPLNIQRTKMSQKWTERGFFLVSTKITGIFQ